jgi:hypothetical protein
VSEVLSVNFCREEICCIFRRGSEGSDAPKSENFCGIHVIWLIDGRANDLPEHLGSPNSDRNCLKPRKTRDLAQVTGNKTIESLRDS